MWRVCVACNVAQRTCGDAFGDNVFLVGVGSGLGLPAEDSPCCCFLLRFGRVAGRAHCGAVVDIILAAVAQSRCVIDLVCRRQKQ